MRTNCLQQNIHSSILRKESKQTERFSTSDDFLIKSQFNLPENPNFSGIQYLKNRVISMQKSRDLMKDILEEQIFTLKQTFVSLKISMHTFIQETIQQTAKAIQELYAYTSNPSIPTNAYKVMHQMKTKISNIQLSNKTLQQDNRRMLNQLNNLKTSFDLKDTQLYDNVLTIAKEENSFLRTQLIDKQRKILQLQSKNNQSPYKIKNLDSRLAFHLRASTQYGAHSPKPYPKDEILMNMLSPIKGRNSQCSMYRPSQERSSIKYNKDNSEVMVSRQRQQAIYETQKSKIIRRKPGVQNTYYRRPRQSTNFQQLESRINSIKEQLKSQIRSVEKKKS